MHLRHIVPRMENRSAARADATNRRKIPLHNMVYVLRRLRAPLLPVSVVSRDFCVYLIKKCVAPLSRCPPVLILPSSTLALPLAGRGASTCRPLFWENTVLERLHTKHVLSSIIKIKMCVFRSVRCTIILG